MMPGDVEQVAHMDNSQAPVPLLCLGGGSASFQVTGTLWRERNQS